MLQHLLIAIDGAEATAQIATRAVQLAQPLGARVVLCHVHRAAGPHATATQALARLEAAAQALGVHSTTLSCEHTQAWRALLDAAIGAPADLLCLVPRRQRPLLAWLWGSTTREVLAHATQPVLLLRRMSKTPARYRQILAVATGCPSDRRVFGIALRLAAASVAQLTLLARCAPPAARPRAGDLAEAAEADAQTREHWQDTLAAWRTQASGMGVRCSVEIVPSDHPGRMVAERLHALDADLLVLGRDPEHSLGTLRGDGEVSPHQAPEDVDVLVVP